MELEKKLVEYVLDTNFEDFPKQPVDIGKNLVLTTLGTTIAGATAEGCETLVNQAKEWGGKEEATILIYGSRVPAHNAAFVNSVMARALDFCDGVIPGMHVAASAVPTALAAAELAGGCSGKEFLTAIVLGAEVANRLNSSSLQPDYDGFDPTGVCTIFATTAIAGRILHLNPKQMWDALALAFNKAGGSFQSNVDGSLAVRVIQGFVSQGGIICAQLAQRGITGPKNFLEGIYGYFHLYTKDKYDPKVLVGDWGKRFDLTKIIFKKYPSCGVTTGSTDAILDLVREKGIAAEDVARVDVRVTPHCYNLAGHPFEIGDNPKVNAQFNIQYCVANALLRKSSRLEHFDEPYIREPKIMELIKKIQVIAAPQPGHLTTDISVTTRDGSVYHKNVAIPSGLPGNPLTNEEHNEHFRDCISYAKMPLPQGNIDKIRSLVDRVEELEDVCSLIPLLISQGLK